MPSHWLNAFFFDSMLCICVDHKIKDKISHELYWIFFKIKKMMHIYNYSVCNKNTPQLQSKADPQSDMD